MPPHLTKPSTTTKRLHHSGASYRLSQNDNNPRHRLVDLEIDPLQVRPNTIFIRSLVSDQHYLSTTNIKNTTKLDRMVANLNAEGVEDTPYEDKNW